MTPSETILIEQLGRSEATADVLRFGRTNETPDAVRAMANNSYDVLIDETDLDRASFVEAFLRGYLAHAATMTDPAMPWASQVAEQLAALRKPKTVICAQCGAAFTGTGRARYCSRSCENRAYRARKASNQ